MKKKTVVRVLVLAFMVSALTVGALAADGDVSSVMTTAFQTMVSDLIAMIGAILPIALSVVGMSVAIGFGVKWFKKLVGKA